MPGLASSPRSAVDKHHHIEQCGGGPDEKISLEFVQSFQTRVQVEGAIDVARLEQLKITAAWTALTVDDFAYLSSEVSPTPGDKHFRCKRDRPFRPFTVSAVSASTATLRLELSKQ